MSSKLLAALATTIFLPALCLSAQQPAAQPIQSMPYTPSLDVSSLDRSVDPCVDFYKFSCGGWLKNNPIPADQSGWSVYAKLGNENQQFLWGILEADAKATNRTPVQQKVGDYFAACMNTAVIDALGIKPAQPGLARIDALKTRPELIAAISDLHHAYPGGFFFGSSTGQDAEASRVLASSTETPIQRLAGQSSLSATLGGLRLAMGLGRGSSGSSVACHLKNCCSARNWLLA